MSIFKLRPLAFGCFCAIVAMYALYFLGNVASIILICLAAASLVAFVILTAVTKTDAMAKFFSRILPVCLCLIIAGVSTLFTFAKSQRLLEKYEGEQALLTIEIVDIISQSYATTARGVAFTPDGEIRLLVTIKDTEMENGAKIQATVMLRALEDSAIGYSERNAYLDDGIIMCAEIEDYEIISVGNEDRKGFFEKINEKLCEYVEKCTNSDTSALICAMLLGNKEQIEPNISRDFSRLGISHILALSGIHLSLITSMISAILDATRLRKRTRYFTLISVMALFVCITGFSPSAIRAAIMLGMFYALNMIGFDSDGITSLFLAVLLIMVISPYSIFSVSLILSFAAILACICTSKLTRGVRVLYRIRPKLIRGMIYTIITSIGVTVFTLPIMAIFFDHVSVFAPIFNVIFVPILTLLLYLSPLVLLLGGIPYLSNLVVHPAQLITRVTLFLTDKIAKADFLTLSVVGVAKAIGIIIIVLGITLLVALSKKKRRISLCVVALGISVIATTSICAFVSNVTSVTISSYEQSSADTVAVESENEVMIIEMSSPSPTISSHSISYASKLGYSDIDLYIITDYGNKIVDSVDYITDAAIIRGLMLPSPRNDDERLYKTEIEKIALEKGISISEIPEKLEFGDTCVDFMEYKRLGRSTRRVVCFSVSAKGSRLTYLGSGSYEAISYFPGNYAAASDAIVFGGYGPTYKARYFYELPRLKCAIFHDDAINFSDLEIPDSMIKKSGHKIIFKG